MTAQTKTITQGGTDSTARSASVHPLRAISFNDPVVNVERRDDGTIYLRPTQPLGDYPLRITDRLHHFAKTTPQRVFMAERVGPEGWRELSYATLLAASRHIASGLLARGLSPDRPVMILSGNSIDHALVAFGSLYAGVPFCPVSPAYSLVSRDYGKLAYLMKLLTPGLVFVDDADKFADALIANVPEGTEIVASFGSVPGRKITMLADLIASPLFAGLDAVHDKIGPDTIAKFLLTSGSTGNPKAVINTQRMICANQVMIRETLAFLKDEPPVIIDWLPWNHTFGGNHNIGLTLFNGGSMYLDQGKPVPGGIEETVRNLREISPTVYFNVPKGYESLLPYFREDPGLRKTFFSRLHAMFFSGAALAPHVWNELDELSVAETGTRVPMLTGLGSTETAPFFMSVNPRTSRSGHVGLPVPGNEAKLVPNNGKMEVRAKGPNVTPGYWRLPEVSAAAFDSEGYYQMGDALKPVDPNDFNAGFDFDGRVAEDFKLASGTWVSVGPLRARFVAACAPLARDVIIAGINRDEIAAIVVLDLDGCRLINPTLPMDDLAATAADPLIVAAFRERFAKFQGTATGSSTRITRAVLLGVPLSIDKGEVTDKGSINQRAVLENRKDLIERIYAATPGDDIILAR
ncbi:MULTISPECIES: feruloyl-CoA synthase [Bradyrhizobium]|jgi:feruloyl-CoA synthase|uniref:Feruloyl-CoA synthase n=2 Tax=Bradyrhizobium TaxID=374 RepID=A0ABS5G926_9BRAD|nr:MULTISPECIES: feruloyl-CoA synthase [Bradyrhizobium]MBR1137665.1 feruloyl-CoA synthase [Bradyrhizobium denitrificans]MDU1494947.1 feruloyl-CoA synthase [Bradyrhizobium sp.]MDU1545034.1 feruloyl-CoA synthase [Bradyrhizobium sp.]MDU1665652.1 feruloyl-CoA synthase [Bradyrhizobium sp.]MDU3040300.1 feruloyl-CoA synthase [Bradyrhizobium sp.]